MFPKPNFKRRKPKRGQRGLVTPKEYQRAVDAFGECCTECGDGRVEMHHIVYRSQGGRGGFRNLIPLCEYHHELAHKSRAFSDEIKASREVVYGKHFYCDRFDLFEHGLIDDPNEEAFEEYMQEVEVNGES